MQPNTAALLAAIFFAVVAFPWNATLKRIDIPVLFVIMGIAYIVTGICYHALTGTQTRVNFSGVGWGIVAAVIMMVAMVFYSYMLGHPSVNIPVAITITAAYPVLTALISYFFIGQRFSVAEVIFIAMAVGGVVGLGLFSKSA